MADNQPQHTPSTVTDCLPDGSSNINGSHSTNVIFGASFDDSNAESYGHPMHRQRSGGQRHVRQFSITSIPTGEKRKSADTTRFILLEKKAIDTIQKCSSISEYNNLALQYLSQVSEYTTWHSIYLYFFFLRCFGFYNFIYNCFLFIYTIS